MDFGNDDENQHPSFGMMISQQQMQAHMHMQQLQMWELKTSMESFLDSLSPDQTLGLSRMLALFNDNPGYQHVVYGQLSSIMRLVHKICGTCGDTKHSTMEHLTAEQPAMQPPEPDYRWLVGLSPADQIKRLNVTESSQHPGQFICYACQSEFSTLFNRASQGRDCPVCVSRARLASDLPDDKLGYAELYFRYRVAESHTVEDGCYCFDCFTEFPTIRHRIDQGLRCPVCAVQPEVNDGESPHPV